MPLQTPLPHHHQHHPLEAWAGSTCSSWAACSGLMHPAPATQHSTAWHIMACCIRTGQPDRVPLSKRCQHSWPGHKALRGDPTQRIVVSLPQCKTLPRWLQVGSKGYCCIAPYS
jgi:hypothetical protein